MQFETFGDLRARVQNGESLHDIRLDVKDHDAARGYLESLDPEYAASGVHWNSMRRRETLLRGDTPLFDEYPQNAYWCGVPLFSGVSRQCWAHWRASVRIEMLNVARESLLFGEDFYSEQFEVIEGYFTAERRGNETREYAREEVFYEVPGTGSYNLPYTKRAGNSAGIVMNVRESSRHLAHRVIHLLEAIDIMKYATTVRFMRKHFLSDAPFGYLTHFPSHSPAMHFPNPRYVRYEDGSPLTHGDDSRRMLLDTFYDSLNGLNKFALRQYFGNLDDTLF